MRISVIYKKTEVAIEVNRKKTEEFWATKGVRQGCSISPTLFSIYITNMIRLLEDRLQGEAMIRQKNVQICECK